MKNVRQQKMIASILLDIGLDDDIIEVITSLTKEEIDFQSGLCKSVSFVAGMCICKEKYKENAPEFFMCGS